MTSEVLSCLPVRPVETIRPETPWAALMRRMWPVTLTYFCYGWCLWLYLNWLPLFFKNTYHLDLKESALYASSVFLAGMIGDALGGYVSDLIFHKTGHLRLARLSVVVFGFVGALLSLMVILLTHDITMITLSLASGFFFAELVIGPMWSIPMDIAPKFSGTAAGLMNIGSAGELYQQLVESSLGEEEFLTPDSQEELRTRFLCKEEGFDVMYFVILDEIDHLLTLDAKAFLMLFSMVLGHWKRLRSNKSHHKLQPR